MGGRTDGAIDRLDWMNGHAGGRGRTDFHRIPHAIQGCSRIPLYICLIEINIKLPSKLILK